MVDITAEALILEQKDLRPLGLGHITHGDLRHGMSIDPAIEAVDMITTCQPNVVKPETVAAGAPNMMSGKIS